MKKMECIVNGWKSNCKCFTIHKIYALSNGNTLTMVRESNKRVLKNKLIDRTKDCWAC